MRRRGRDRYGTPAGTARPQAIDPWSGFKVDHERLVPQWDGQYVLDENCDRRNPQDYVRGIKNNVVLDNPRPETPDSFVALNIIWQDGSFMTGQQGQPLITQGIDPGDTL